MVILIKAGAPALLSRVATPLCRFCLTGAVAAALFFLTPAGSASAFNTGATNPGARYVPYGGGAGKFHTNPGGKYVYRGYSKKFHTNPGGKYVYPGWSKWQPNGLSH